MSISKKHISNQIKDNLAITSNEGKLILEYFIKLLKDNANEKNIKISGFGSFQLKKTPKRIGRNPKTKESYIIHEREKIVFKTSYKIKKILNL